jgi:hypothetical protein
MFKDSLAIDKFLGNETGGSKHGKASVLKFLRLQDLELFGVRRLQSQGVKTNVTGGVIRSQKSGLGNGDILGVDPSNLGTCLFRRTNEDGEKGPEWSWDLRKVCDSWALDGRVEQERRAFDSFTHKETDGGQHSHTSMGQLGFTVTLEGWFIGLGGESKRIPDSNGWEGSWDGIHSEGRGSNFGGFLGRERAECSNRGGEKGDSGEEFHDGRGFDG